MGSVNPTAYWKKLRPRLNAEGNQTVTNYRSLKMIAPDGKIRMTDVADTEQLFRLIQSIPSLNSEPFKLWLAKVASERIDDMQDPDVGSDKAFDWNKGFPQVFMKKKKKAWHVTTALHNSRYSQRMFDNHVKLGDVIRLEEKDEILITEIVADIVKEDNLNVNKGLQPLVQKMTCTPEYAFRTEYTGGFDVVIGNSPYVNANDLKRSFTEKADKTLPLNKQRHPPTPTPLRGEE